MFARFWNDESGPELVEWAVVTIILLVAAIVLYLAIGRLLGGLLCGIQCWLAKAKTSTGHKTDTQGACDNAQIQDGGKCSDVDTP
jgi:Flp pilus assembly pilin Flp